MTHKVHHGAMKDPYVSFKSITLFLTGSNMRNLTISILAFVSSAIAKLDNARFYYCAFLAFCSHQKLE